MITAKAVRFILLLLSASLPCVSFAWSWNDLWLTPNQQAQQLMNQSRFADAEKRFEDSAWRASAAYRAGHYDDAAKQFETLNTNQGFYNQGNALAHMGQYEQAIQAYDRALNYNPNDEDARFNRKIIADLLKKQKQDQQNQNQQKKDQQKQDQQKQDQQKQDQQKQDQQKQDQQKQDQQKQDQQKQDQQKQDQQKQDQQKQDQQKQDQQKQDQQKQDQQKQDQQKQDQQKQEQKQDQQNQDQQKQQPDGKPNPQKQSAAEQEKQRAKQQWLQLIPDDPGGLMREKFLRDHLRKQNGWDQ